VFDLIIKIGCFENKSLGPVSKAAYQFF